MFAAPPYWRPSSILNLRTCLAVVTGPHLSRNLRQQYEKFYNRLNEINTVGHICVVTSVVEMVT
jgi:flagellin-specific chaperone FliS